jgi:uncharacterized phiE125 gp8 family phage protein
MKPYGVLQLVETSPVEFDEPFTVAEAKSFLNCQRDDENFTIQGYISGARGWAEIEQNRDLALKRWDLYVDSFCEREIRLRAPLQSVESIQYTDSGGTVNMLTENTDFIVDLPRGLVMPAYGEGWPSFTPFPSSAIRIRFQSGYSSTHPFWTLGHGAILKQGMRALITAWYWRKLPFALPGEGGVELPYGISACLKTGANTRVR